MNADDSRGLTEHPLSLTGERTVPDVAAENYWFRRHEAAYRLADGRASGMVLDVGCGEGFGAAMLGRSRAVVAMEMVSVLAHKAGPSWPVRTPSLGLFLDLEVRIVDGPVFVDQEYDVDHEIVGLGQSRRTESYWTRSTLTDASTGRATAVVLLHSGVFKDSYPEYPTAASAPG